MNGINRDVKFSGSKPTNVVKIGNQFVKCLVDTGSQVTKLTYNYFEANFKTVVPRNDCFIKLTAANGLSLLM